MYKFAIKSENKDNILSLNNLMDRLIEDHGLYIKEALIISDVSQLSGENIDVIFLDKSNLLEDLNYIRSENDMHKYAIVIIYLEDGEVVENNLAEVINLGIEGMYYNNDLDNFRLEEKVLDLLGIVKN